MFWKFGTQKKIQSHESADARALKSMYVFMVNDFFVIIKDLLIGFEEAKV